MVASYVQLLARRYEGQLDEDANTFIRFAVDGALRMQRMTSELLAFSRISTRAAGFTPVDAAVALEQALSGLRMAIEDSDARITHDPLPVVLADATQLAQVFQNLIENAIKFHGPDVPRIHVSAVRQTADWVFAVQDNGIGIDPRHFDRLFIIFQRLHTEGQYRGSGIGLASCKKIVERHGGRIWVESQPGRGATFSFTLPATERIG